MKCETHEYQFLKTKISSLKWKRLPTTDVSNNLKSFQTWKKDQVENDEGLSFPLEQLKKDFPHQREDGYHQCSLPSPQCRISQTKM